MIIVNQIQVQIDREWYQIMTVWSSRAFRHGAVLLQFH